MPNAQGVGAISEDGQLCGSVQDMLTADHLFGEHLTLTEVEMRSTLRAPQGRLGSIL